MTPSLAQSVALLPAYARQDVTFVSGEGSWLVDADGRRYLDLVAGIAVVGLGHLHPAPLAAAHAQLERLWHTSNLYSTEPGEHLAARLSDRFGGAQAFLCNSGTEAVEAAIKYARKATGRAGIVALNGSFHGRTLGALSITGQPGKQAAFVPLVPGVRFVDPDDVESLRAAAGGEIACIVLEPILGEGGIRPLAPEFVAAARELADEAGALLVFDEVQTGVGRTGTFFCWEQLGVRPDLVTLAKGLANGLPIGALLVADGALTGLVPGDHGSTFGGNPVACAVAAAVVDAITDELLAAVRGKEALVRSVFPATRGRGLLLGIELDRPARPVVDACRQRGVLVGSAGERVLRLTPPLTIPEADLADGLRVLAEVLADG